MKEKRLPGIVCAAYSGMEVIMSVRFNRDNCVSCKKCVEVCPGNLIKIDDDIKAFIKYPEECWGCTSCLKECNHCAIEFYLGADIGGRGSIMSFSNKGDINNWTIKDIGGSKQTILINKNDSNKY